MSKIKIGIFASGNGSNAEAIAKYFSLHASIQVCGLFCNNPEAGALGKAKKLKIPTQTFTFQEFNDPAFYSHLKHLDYLILAGFLWLIPKNIISHFQDRIINIHPSLLPKYGGKGMYGDRIHNTVLQNNENKTGISIHLANESFDKGKLLFQARCEVAPKDGLKDIKNKIHQLEHQFFSKVIAYYIDHHSS